MGSYGGNGLRNVYPQRTTPSLLMDLRKAYICLEGGLRQGDPLSPFLFVIVGEALSHMVEAASQAGLISGFKAAGSIPPISHLQFDDFISLMV